MTDERCLFEPDSLTWRIHSEPAMLIGGLRALLLQALHPRAMAGVRDHSDYKADPWARYGRTRDYIVLTTFGTRAQAEDLAKKVVKIHDRINGTDAVTGKSYDAHDADLLLWVHNCLVQSFMTAYETYVKPLSDEDVTQYLTEMTRASELIRLPVEIVPLTRASLNDYFATQNEFALTEAARESMKVIMSPPMNIAFKPVWKTFAYGAMDLLPKEAADLYGFHLRYRMSRLSRMPNKALQQLGTRLLGQASEVKNAYQRFGLEPPAKPNWIPTSMQERAQRRFGRV